MKKIEFAIIGFLSLGTGMGLNVQYALDDYGWGFYIKCEADLCKPICVSFL